MSAILESVLDAERLADCAANDKRMADSLTGRVIVNGTGEWSEGWAQALRREHSRWCRKCGELLPAHERGCPDEQEDESDD